MTQKRGGQNVIDFFRTLFRIRRTRSVPPMTAMPQPGASIVREAYKIKLMQPCAPEVWVWLMFAGWRVCAVRNDRRQYTVLHPKTIHYLNVAPEEKRQAVLEHFMAGKRPPSKRKRGASPASSVS